MRMPFPRVLPSLLSWSVVAACTGGPATEPMPSFAPMPMGEIALPRAPSALVVTHPVEFEHRWTDARGREWNVAFRCGYATDDAHELLAAASVQTNLLAAHEASLAICKGANLDTIAGIVACETRLQEQLTDVLFPCAPGLQGTQVTTIEWTLWLVR